MHELLKLDNQLCFQLYTANRLMTRLYKPLLDPYQLTYPQYLVLLVLFETDNISVKDLGEKLYLDSGTLTPVLKRMESCGFIERVRSKDDERKLEIALTFLGKNLEAQLLEVPLKLCQKYTMPLEEAIKLRETLKKLNQWML
ncbi:MAG: MarR family transcriptional regulator [Clostridia bacterium]|nr:MarR family transcriptional regulator [Clostridia bacterium]